MIDVKEKEIKIGQTIRPIYGGRDLKIISYSEMVEDVGEACFFGQQIEDPCAFSILVEKDLKENWEIIEE